MLATILYVPFVRDLFRPSRPRADDAVVIRVAGIGALVWMEIVKKRVRAAPAGAAGRTVST
jgi:hypothetical protein